MSEEVLVVGSGGCGRGEGKGEWELERVALLYLMTQRMSVGMRDEGEIFLGMRIRKWKWRFTDNTSIMNLCQILMLKCQSTRNCLPHYHPAPYRKHIITGKYNAIISFGLL